MGGGGGGGVSWEDNPNDPGMTKEAMMEDLLFKRSAASSASPEAGEENPKPDTAVPEPVWRETGGLFNFEIGRKTILSYCHFVLKSPKGE